MRRATVACFALAACWVKNEGASPQSTDTGGSWMGGSADTGGDQDAWDPDTGFEPAGFEVEAMFGFEGGMVRDFVFPDGVPSKPFVAIRIMEEEAWWDPTPESTETRCDVYLTPREGTEIQLEHWDFVYRGAYGNDDDLSHVGFRTEPLADYDVVTYQIIEGERTGETCRAWKDRHLDDLVDLIESHSWGAGFGNLARDVEQSISVNSTLRDMDAYITGGSTYSTMDSDYDGLPDILAEGYAVEVAVEEETWRMQTGDYFGYELVSVDAIPANGVIWVHQYLPP